MNPQFNLLDQPWIPCVQANGNMVELSLPDTLVQAQDLREICAETPLITASLLRLLLAILHRVFGPTDTDVWIDEVWELQHFNRQLLDNYFYQWHGRFNLFDPKYPFYQTANPPKSLDLKSVNKLTPELAAGNNATLFDHTTDDDTMNFSSKEAAQRLITAQTFAVGGGQSGIPKRNFRDAPHTKGILFLLEGDNLFETLSLNLVAYNNTEPLPISGDDAPAWEMDNPHKPDRHIPYGYLDYLTWQSRIIKLVPEERNGQIVVNQMYFSQGLWLDPPIHSPMHSLRKSEQHGYTPLRFSEHKALWRDSSSLLNLNRKEDDPIEPPPIFEWVAEIGELSSDKLYRFGAIGLKTDDRQAAAIHFHQYERLPLPLELLRDEDLLEYLRESLGMAEKISNLLYGVTWELVGHWVKPISSEENKKESKIDKTNNDYKNIFARLDPRRRYWARLEVPFRQFIQSLPINPEAAQSEWQTTVINTARTAFDQATASIDDPIRGLKAVVLARRSLEWGLGRYTQEETISNQLNQED